MEWNEIINSIFQVCIIPLLAVLTTYAVKWINAKAEELKAETANQYAQKYINMLNETITTTVIAVNQTYVDALKKQNAFDKEAQEKAFYMVFDKVMKTINEEAETYLNEVIKDLNSYITTQIEANVREYKI